MAEQKTELERAQERKFAEQQKAISKQHEEQNLELQRAQERKLAEQQRAAVLKEHEERICSERARAEEETVATLEKQIQGLREKIEQFGSQKEKTDELGKSSPEIKGQGTSMGEAGELISEIEKARQDLRREYDRARGSSPFPPAPDPLHPVSSLRELRRWLFRRDE